MQNHSYKRRPTFIVIQADVATYTIRPIAYSRPIGPTLKAHMHRAYIHFMKYYGVRRERERERDRQTDRQTETKR